MFVHIGPLDLTGPVHISPQSSRSGTKCRVVERWTTPSIFVQQKLIFLKNKQIAHVKERKKICEKNDFHGKMFTG